MTTKTKHTAIIPGGGTDQQQRFLEALNPASLNLIDLGTAEWMKFARKFAAKVNYFNLENQKEGNWQDFFADEAEIQIAAGCIRQQPNTPSTSGPFYLLPEVARFQQKSFQSAHSDGTLDFYYHEILKIDKQAPVPDQVHVLFELAKNITQEKISTSTALDAGKDPKGSKLTYKTQDELIANKATVAQLKNVYHHSESGLKGIKASEVANSFDGLGAPSPSGDLKWYPFGYLKTNYSDSTPELADARLGFAIASPVLLLNEGIRTIQLNMILKDDVSMLTGEQA